MSRLLLSFQTDKFLLTLAKCINEEDPEVRSAVASGFRGDEKAQAKLKELADQDESGEVQKIREKILEEIGRIDKKQRENKLRRRSEIIKSHERVEPKAGELLEGQSGRPEKVKMKELINPAIYVPPESIKQRMEIEE